MFDDIKPPEAGDGLPESVPKSNDQEPAFVPPETISATDTEEPKPVEKSEAPKPSKQSRFKKMKTSLATWWGSRKLWQKILIIVLAVLLAAALAFGVYTLFKAPKEAPVPQAQVEAVPTTEASKLTGVQVDPKFNKLPVTGIMIENSLDARPQSALKDAGVVFEAIAEGGITRFLALYQEAEPSYIGPVRSARPYYLRWLLPFDAPLAHVGGSPDAMADIKSLGVKDLDQFFNPQAYWRVSTRYAPHNVYTSMAKLRSLEKSKGWTSSNFTGFLRKEEQPLTTPKARLVDISISGPDFGVHYTYNKKTNSYLRSEGGAKHIDEKSHKQLSPKVVVVLVTRYGLASDGHHSTYQTNGSGTVYVFQDGGVTKGKWHKSDDKTQLTFTDATGAPLGLNPGQTWITVVGASSDVSYKK